MGDAPAPAQAPLPGRRTWRTRAQARPVEAAGQEAHKWGRESVETVKNLAAELSERIARGGFQDSTGPGD
ncbi:hypothetical protein [Streptomyces winkii]|uniref:hypothetical protein n=1 Tax=Streptomyces winkii TaxID=3051178 RepID=UPI0028D33646|nr:hypothetical protein [Streptomyces sp. DSM 40971]